MPCCWLGICGGYCAVIILAILDQMPLLRYLGDWWLRRWLERLRKEHKHGATETD